MEHELERNSFSFVEYFGNVYSGQFYNIYDCESTFMQL